MRTFSKTWSMAAARLGYLVGPAWLVAELEKVVLPYHLDAAKQIAGRLALRFVDEMDDRVKQIVAERERHQRGAARRLAVDVFPSGANFVLFRPRHRAGSRRVAGARSTAACWCATARAGRGSTTACGSRSARRTRTTPSSARSRRSLA